jgi:hypothetical protein
MIKIWCEEEYCTSSDRGMLKPYCSHLNYFETRCKLFGETLKQNKIGKYPQPRRCKECFDLEKNKTYGFEIRHDCI